MESKGCNWCGVSMHDALRVVVVAAVDIVVVTVFVDDVSVRLR